MSWLNDILSLFKEIKQDSVEIEKIDLIYLDDWLVSQQQQIISKNDLQDVISNYVRVLKSKRWELECKLDQWEELFPPEKKLNYKEILIETRNVLGLIVFVEGDLVLSTLNLNSLLDEKINKLMKTIEDNPFVDDYSYLLSEEEKKSPNVTINPILQELLNLDGFRSEFEKRIVKSGMRVLEKLNLKSNSIKSCNDKISQINRDIRSKQERLENNSIKKEEKENFVDELKNNPSYANLISSNENHKNYLDELEKKKEEVIVYFSKLKPVLQKYQQFDTNNSVVSNYLNDSLSSFLNDESLFIIHVLNHLRAMLLSNKIELDSEIINLVNPFLEKNKVENLRQLQLQIINLDSKAEELEKSQENKEFLDKFEDAKYRLQHFKEQEEKLNEQIFLLEENLSETVDLRGREIKMLQDLARIGLNKDLVINLN